MEQDTPKEKSKLDLSPPRTEAAFIDYWDIFLPDIELRENLKQSHMETLKIYCDMNVQYDHLNKLLEEEGYTYSVSGRNGSQIKSRPEVSIWLNLLKELRQYAAALGLQLVKDTAMSNDKTKTKNEEDWT